MKRVFLLTLACGLLTVPGFAQRRGGGYGGGAGRGGFSMRGPLVGGRGAGAFRAPHSGNRFSPGFRGSFHRPFIYSNRLHRRGVYAYPWSYGYPWVYGYAGAYSAYPGFYGDYEYPSADITYRGYNPSATYVDPNMQYQQQDEINNLKDEIVHLRQNQPPRSGTQDGPEAPPETNSEAQPATILVFHDKHTEAVQNYAIVGKTLWIFSTERTRKIPLSELDIPATREVNEDRGLDFHLPDEG